LVTSIYFILTIWKAPT